MQKSKQKKNYAATEEKMIYQETKRNYAACEDFFVVVKLVMILMTNLFTTKLSEEYGDKNVTKIITQFGESSNKVTKMSPNSSPNLVITKFVTKFITEIVTKHLGLLYEISTGSKIG